jgi:hypothetical protein
MQSFFANREVEFKLIERFGNHLVFGGHLTNKSSGGDGSFSHQPREHAIYVVFGNEEDFLENWKSSINIFFYQEL